MKMSEIHPKLPRLVVRDSFDEDDPSDIDEEVFIRDGKHGIMNMDDECGLKKPLMPPRKKNKMNNFSESSQLPLKTLFSPFCYTLIGFSILMGLITICAITFSKFPEPMNEIKNWFSPKLESSKKTDHLVPCTSLKSQVIWTKTFSKFSSEAPLKSTDVNSDNIEDIILGFGLDKINAPDYVCSVYFDKSAPCLGGVMALDGRTGDTIWIHWTNHAIFSIDCTLDLTSDNIKDCVITGRGGILQAIDGRDGLLIWEYKDSLLPVTSQNFYDTFDARFIADIDNDQIGDVIASHTWHSQGGSQSELLLISGKAGNKVQSYKLFQKEQVFVAPQIIVHPDGETYFIIATKDDKKSGGLYIIQHSKLLKDDFKLQQIYHGEGRGISLPLLLMDVNLDGTEDIIVTLFNSTIITFNGLTFKEMWNYTIPNTEVISVPIPGYYNDDNIPDLMVKHQYGPGFPVYYYTTTTILDGKSGKPLLNSPMEDTMSGQMSGLSLTVNDFGNDWFLYWSADCLNFEKSREKYDFIRKPNLDADLCKLRFNSTLVTTLYAFSQHVAPPGIPIYNSENWKKLEFNNSYNPQKETYDYGNSRLDYSNNQNPPETDLNYYPKSKNINYENALQEHENFLNKQLEDLNQNSVVQMNNDNNYDDEEDENDDDFDDEQQRLLASRQSNEIRLQRSEKSNGRVVNNDTNDVENTLDPSMDYTNGQNKDHNYLSNFNFSRSNNFDDSTDYLNIPDIDFVDNIKEAEALGGKKKRDINDKSSDSAFNTNSKKFNKRLKRIRENKKAFYYIDTSAGLQRQPPTGIILPSLDISKDKNTMDLIFSTYWLPSSPTSIILLPKDLDCIKKSEENSGRILSFYEKESIITDCLAKRKIDRTNDETDKKTALGQMTIYRMKLKCLCPFDMLPGQKCKDIAKEQSWPGHLGISGNGYFVPFRSNKN